MNNKKEIANKYGVLSGKDEDFDNAILKVMDEYAIQCQEEMFTRADVNYLMYKATRWDTFKEDEPEYKMDVYEFFDYIVEKLNKN